MKTKPQYFVMALLGAALLLLVGLVLVSPHFAPAAAAAGSLQANGDLPRTITVIGEGQVSSAPDIAVVQVGVQISDADPKEATARAAEAMNNLLAALKGEGIAEKDIQTSYFNVYVDRPYGPEGPAGGAQYQVSNNVQVTIRALDRVTDILGVAIEAGANNINSIDFQLSDTGSLQSEARAIAVDNARAKAEELAELNGVAVGQVVSVSEVIGSSPYPGERAYAAVGLGGGGAGPISPGDVSVTSQLQITYAILR